SESRPWVAIAGMRQRCPRGYKEKAAGRLQCSWTAQQRSFSLQQHKKRREAMNFVKSFGLVGGLLLTGACATQPSGQPETAGSVNSQPVAQASGRCDAEKAQRFIGQPYTDALGDEARQA